MSESWVRKLVIATERHEAKETSAQAGAGNYRWDRKSVTIPAGTIVLVVKEEGGLVVFMHNENTWEASRANYELCKPSQALAGKTFCFTGALGKPRDYFETLVTLHGGEFKKSVTNELNYLVMAFKNSHSRKAQAAKARGIICIQEEDLMKLINSGETTS